MMENIWQIWFHSLSIHFMFSFIPLHLALWTNPVWPMRVVHRRSHHHILLIPHGVLHTPGPQAQHTQTLRTILLTTVNRQTVWGPKQDGEIKGQGPVCIKPESYGKESNGPQQGNKSRSIADHPFSALPLFACCQFLFFSFFFPSHSFQRFTFQGCCFNCSWAVCTLS